MNPPTENKTLRDEFAMAALTGLISSDLFVEKANEQSGGHGIKRRELLIQEAYLFADAMLEARKK